jgi:hypothetical protein
MRLSGPSAITPGTISGDALTALKCGDVQSLLDIHKQRWHGLVMMADDDGADADADADKDKDKDEPKDEPVDDAGKDDKGSDDTISREDYDKILKRMQAADRRADDAEKKIREQEDAKKDDLTKAQDRVTELEQSVEEMTGTIRTLRLENAFLTSNKHTWHDSDIALNLAQSKGYIDSDIVAEDGSVDKVALGKALDRLAKEHGYLVKTEDKKKDDEPGGPSGEPAGGRSDNSKDEKARRKALESRFPVLTKNR